MLSSSLFEFSELRKIGLILLALVSVPVSAYETSLEVIDDLGGVPAPEVFTEIFGIDSGLVNESLKKERLALRDGAFSKEAQLSSLSTQFPITSTVKEQHFSGRDFQVRQENLAQPIAFVGNGSISKEWLGKHKNKLKSLNTYVVLVNADSKTDYVTISKAYGGVVVAMDVNSLMDQYRIPGLPALLTADGVYQ